jgi:hypothetical protein
MTSTATATTTDASSGDWPGLDTPDTNPACYFDPDDVDDTDDWASETDWFKTHKQSYYRHLDHVSRGYVNGKFRNDPFYTFQANQHLTEAIASQFPMTSSERTRAVEWARRLDMQRLGYSRELVITSICAFLTHDTDRSDGRKCHPQTPIEEWPAGPRQLYESWSDRYQSLYSKVYGTVASRIRNWSASDDAATERMDRRSLGGYAPLELEGTEWDRGGI